MKTGEFPNFQTFADFVQIEAEIVCDPMTSTYNTRKGTDSGEKKYEKFKALSTEAQEVDKKTTSACPMCSEDHYLTECKVFASKSHDDKMVFVRENYLCFKCLRHGHRSFYCRTRVTCKTCSGPHTTSMHRDKDYYFKGGNSEADEKAEDVTLNPNAREFKTGEQDQHQSAVSHSSRISTNRGSYSSMIVPVWVSSKQNPQKEVLTYAMLDTQSDTTFMLDKTAKRLGVRGAEVQLNLSTMLKENKLIDCERITGVTVRSFHGGKEVDLPALYTRDIMPCNRSHIPTKETARRWSHLQRIKDRLPPLQDCDVGLLIGYNCTDALVPLEVIPSQNNGPFAQKTLLGWGIVGTIDMSVNNEDVFGFSHRIVAESVSIDKNPVHSVLESTVQEVLSPKQVPAALKQEIADVKNQETKLSRNDKKFLKVLENNITTTEDKRYQMLLPFKGQLEKKRIATSQYNQLIVRCAEDAKYWSDNVEFMNGMFEKGFAEPVPETDVDEKKARYIPQYNVYHPPKKKMREVFDCLPRYNCVNLNDVKCSTNVEDWQYMETSENPADCVSHGLNVTQLNANEM